MFALIILAASPAAAPIASCTAANAVYALRGAPGVTAGFVQQRFQINFASDLFFFVDIKGRRWWFSQNAPNGDAGVYLTPDRDPRTITPADRETEPVEPAVQPPQVDFDMFDSRFDVMVEAPQSGSAAPAHLYARGLGPLLWNNPAAAANDDPSATAVAIPLAMYDLVACQAASVPRR
jgi:hypothetical protein